MHQFTGRDDIYQTRIIFPAKILNKPPLIIGTWYRTLNAQYATRFQKIWFMHPEQLHAAERGKKGFKNNYCLPASRHDLRDGYLEDIFGTALLELRDEPIDRTLLYNGLDAVVLDAVELADRGLLHGRQRRNEFLH